MNGNSWLQGRLWARWGLDPELGVLDGVSAEWRAGVWTRIVATTRPPRDYPPEACFPQHLLTPGLLNAHAHLDYSFLKGALPRGQGFVPWLRAMIQARRAFTAEAEPAARQACADGLRELLSEGVTEVWDIASFGWADALLRTATLRAISFSEFLAPSQTNWEQRWVNWRAEFAAQRARDEAALDHSVRSGVSPHAAYSLCPPALEALADWARAEGLPLAMHLSESPEECEMLAHGQGKLFDLLSGLSPHDLRQELGVGCSAICRAAEAEALGPATLAIHCNLPEAEEVRFLAESGAVVVFCPGSHAFFGYPPYPLAAYRQAGVRLALGTDSLASNDALSIRAEALRLQKLAPDWKPLEILACATGALLGETPPYGGRGRLAPGRPAQWALWQMEVSTPPTAEALLASLLAPATPLAASSAGWPIAS